MMKKMMPGLLNRIKAGLQRIHVWLEWLRVRLQPKTVDWLSRLKGDPHQTEHDFVRDADSFMIQQEPLRARLLMRIFLVVVLLFILWAALARIDEITRGHGKVIPSQQLQVLQSLDGGLVETINVHEGELVEAGQILLQVDPTRFESSVRESRAQYLSLMAKAARLNAIGTSQPFVPPAEVVKEDPQTAMEEERLYETATTELQAQVSIARQQLIQREQELSEARVKQSQAAQAYQSSMKELQVTKPLLASGAVSEVELLRLERDVARFRAERDVASSQIARAQSAIAEATRKIQEVELAARNEASKEYSETMAKLNALIQGTTGLADKVKQTAIRSPVKGTVKRLLVNTVGGVVQPGRDVVEIVPFEDKLVLEAKVAPRDIAFLKPGQEAIVKFTAYDFSIYGGMEATLSQIGADSITDDKGETYYMVRVVTKKSSLGNKLPIIPGMVAEVDIITGKKSILSYLMKPVLRAKQAAMTER